MYALRIINICLLLLILASCSSDPSQSAMAPPSVPVITTTVRVEDVPVYIESLGVLRPTMSVDIRPQVSGILKTVYFTEGQNVKKGMPLFAIDSQSYVIKLKEVESQLAQDRASLATSQKTLERHRGLVQQELISKQEWEHLTAQVMKEEATVQADEARVAAAKLDVERCLIMSPIDGKVGKLQLHPGNLVATHSPNPLVTVSQLNPLRVDFNLTEREYLQLTADHLSGSYPIEVASFSQPQDRLKGTLTFQEAGFDPVTGLLPTSGIVPNPTLCCLAGQPVKVFLTLSVIKGAHLIPQKAVKINQKGPYVFVVKADQTVELRQVILGAEYDKDVIIEEGLQAGEQIVTDGHLRLSPGLKVEVKSEDSAS